MEKLHFAKGRMILPLTGSSYELGKMKEAIDLIEDTQLAEIARAEACYFTADAKGCVEHVKKYLASDDVMLRLSADMLYVFANLTLGNAGKAQYLHLLPVLFAGSAHRCKAVSAKSTGRRCKYRNKIFLYICLLSDQYFSAYRNRKGNAGFRGLHF